jgi:TolA-binding protein
MMEEERHIYLFERYRNNELGESELKDFEARLSYDSDFRNAFEEYQRVEDGIRNHFRNELKSKLQEVDKAMDETPKKHSIVRLIAWTSTVAAAIVIGVFIYQHFSQSDYQQLAQNYWPHEEGLPVKMSDASHYDEAMNAFKLEEWNKAERLLTAIDSDTAAYFLGEIAYRKGKLPIAISHFSRVNRGSEYYHESQFKLSLIHLALGDIKKAKEILDYLQKGDTDFSDEAKEILTRI